MTFAGRQDDRDRLVVGLKKAETKGRIVQGMGVEEDGVGFVGAIAGTYDHEVCARVLGCPVQLVYVAERLFEEMPEAAARMWPGVFVGGLPVGRELGGYAEASVGGAAERVGEVGVAVGMGAAAGRGGLTEDEEGLGWLVEFLGQPVVAVGPALGAATRALVRKATNGVGHTAAALLGGLAAWKGRVG